jgi:uncharacterized protein (TIGR02453 family)
MLRRSGASPAASAPSCETDGDEGGGDIRDSEAHFDGFGRGALALYRGLAKDNSRDYWHAHKESYVADVADPMHALAELLAPTFGEGKVFRPNRDVRFTPDKRPYKENASLAISRPSGAALYLELSTRGLRLGGGLWQPARDQLVRFRELQDDCRVTGGLDRLLRTLDDAGLPMSDDAALKTAPRGWSKDHPRIELLRLTSLTVGEVIPVADWMFTSEALERITGRFSEIDRWNAWLDTHVGASVEPLRGR